MTDRTGQPALRGAGPSIAAVVAFIAVNLACTLLWPVGLEVRQILRGDRDRLLEPPGRGIYTMMAFIDSRVPPDETMLVFRPAEMGFYSRQHVIISDDPRLAALYVAATPEEAARVLERERVRWILDPGRPGYYQLSRTVMASLVGDARFAELVHAAGGVRLYRLR